MIPSRIIDYSGRTVDKYRIKRLIGSGGMGSVYLGEHSVIGKKVAIKFLHSGLIEDKEQVKRFVREAKASVIVAHPNIIDVLDLGISEENERYLVMEYLEGESLDALLKRKERLDIPAACAILEPTLLALDAAHAKGIVHRDLKPDNIFLTHTPQFPTVVKIIDFGVSKFTEETGESQLTLDGRLLGTLAYMPPEQVHGVKALDGRADLYAVGVILFQMLTGQLPFHASNQTALIAAIITQSPTPPRTYRPDLSEDIESLIMQLLNKEPVDRPENARILLDQLRAFSTENERQTQLIACSEDLSEVQVAGGGLGTNDPREADDASKQTPPKEPPNRPTPMGWASTISGYSKWRVISGGAFSIVLIVFVMILLVFISAPEGPPVHRDAAQNTTHKSSKTLSTGKLRSQNGIRKPRNVRLEIVGVPEGAVMMYDGAWAPRNPFNVLLERRRIKLEVSADGFTNYATWVVPDVDQRIEVRLKPVDKSKTEQPDSNTSISSEHNKNSDQISENAPEKLQSAESSEKTKNGAEIKRQRNTKKYYFETFEE